jgi:hypothetical protein
MSCAESFWFLSACGAVFSFIAGFAARGVRRGPGNASSRDGLAELEACRIEVSALREERRAWLAERTALEDYAAGAHANYVELEVHALAAALDEPQGLGLEKSEVATASASPLTFETILGRIRGTLGMRAAVLSDQLGLPIASLGTYPDSLAGFCGFIAQAATKAADFLPLGHIRRIVLEDDRMATITACSLAGSEFFVATLTSGPGPDLPHMMEVLNEASSFLIERE